MPARVLILRSNPVAPEPRVDKIASTLGQAGYPVRVLGWDHSGNQPTFEQYENYHLERLALPVTFGRGLANLQHVVHWQRRLLAWLVRERENYDVLHACDFDTVLPAITAARLYRKRLIYDIFDFYADMLRLTPTAIVAAIRSAELWAINRADGLILADEARQQQISGSNPRRTTVIYNSPLDRLADLQGALIDTEKTTPAGLRLAYIGLLQRERGLFELLQVLERHPDWRLDFGGYGPELDELQQAAGQLPNVTWHGRIPHQQALELNARADALIATFDPAIPNNRYSSSNKLFEAMMLARPIVVARDTNMDRLVEAHNCGLVINYGSSQALEEALSRLAQEADLRRQWGRNGRRAYEQLYNWRLMQNRLLGFYREILES